MKGRSRTSLARSSSLFPTSGSGRSSYSAGETTPELSSSLASMFCFSVDMAPGDCRRRTKGAAREGTSGIYTAPASTSSRICRDQLAAGTPWGRLEGTKCVGRVAAWLVEACVRAWLDGEPKRGANCQPDSPLVGAVRCCDCVLTLLSRRSLQNRAQKEVQQASSGDHEKPWQREGCCGQVYGTIASVSLESLTPLPAKAATIPTHDAACNAVAVSGQAHPSGRSDVPEQTSWRRAGSWALCFGPSVNATQDLGKTPAGRRDEAAVRSWRVHASGPKHICRKATREARHETKRNETKG